ncbi:unnamed protein product [Dracunculus medinensis]|uniref:NAC-A/B domain-containing protein n=1 Tax=Dracunculus medinensis TaxID=318479 RepID=A0A0N4ULN7_DRAME|nr:unnamed protein product [Dracunculus medinensis]
MERNFAKVLNEENQFSSENCYKSGEDEKEPSNVQPADSNENSKVQPSKAERRARRILKKLNTKPIQGISRICIKKTNKVQLIIKNPEVHLIVGVGTYLIFGKAELQNIPDDPRFTTIQTLLPNEAPTVLEESSSDVEEDGSVEEKDIQLVISQANVSRKLALKTLKQTNSDIVEAILRLT